MTPPDRFQIKLPAHNIDQDAPRQQPSGVTEAGSLPKTGRSTSKRAKNLQLINEFTDIAMPKQSVSGKLTVQSTYVTAPRTSVETREQQRQTARPTVATDNSVYERYFAMDDDEESNASNEAVQLTHRRFVATPKMGRPTFLKKTVKNIDVRKTDDQSIKQPDNEQPPSSTTPIFIVPLKTENKRNQNNQSEHSGKQSEPCNDQTVFVQSLQMRYELRISLQSTIKELKGVIWQKMKSSVERCEETSHILLLFTHRMHIFESEEMELVSEFVKLAPSEPHFYFYALRRDEQSNEMYTYETKLANIFANDANWWTPVYFQEDAQLPRPQSILLSSLYALRLFFYRSAYQTTEHRLFSNS